ncbi:hypothetical protein RR48_01936 [Papilio machaon]|uniref:Uncharacterized protein n=1 Tax=Papilio machaon TaxID=76193 RepID=A0A0N1PIK1_PAPMA|nr:hypothetical protein RR48_01936 [Papilio machaon]
MKNQNTSKKKDLKANQPPRDRQQLSRVFHGVSLGPEITGLTLQSWF